MFMKMTAEQTSYLFDDESISLLKSVSLSADDEVMEKVIIRVTFASYHVASRMLLIAWNT